jgi:hypothetical protein
MFLGAIAKLRNRLLPLPAARTEQLGSQLADFHEI